jgi:nitrogenase molybdenum-iron protein alpha/beta subunit
LPIEYWRITDITETNLAYFLPKTERFHTILHVPGSHTLYVGPSSCTRRHAIHAIEHGDDRRDSSFLFISEADVISGSYEEMIGDAIAELCEIIEPEPHIFFIAVFCIDDFLGTDEKAMLEDLHARFPGKRFVVDNIDPVTLGKNKNMAMKKHVNIFSFLEPQDSKDNGVNFLGNFVSLEPECEFLHLLKSWGISTVREIFHCRTHEEYQDMARSQLSIVMRFMGEAPAKFMQENMGIPFYYFPPDYNVYDIAKGYKEIAAMLGHEAPDFSADIADVLTDAAQTAGALGDIPIAIDAGALMRPFSAAKALVEYGFEIKYIFSSSHKYNIDEEAELYIGKNHANIEIITKDIYANVNRESDHEIIAIGADCARLLQARHFVDIWHDEGYFGFHGIHRLFGTMRDSLTTKRDWPELPIPGKEEV